MKISRALLLLAAALIQGCAAPRTAEQRKQPAAPAGPGAAIVFEKRNFKLVKTPDPDLEAALDGMLSASYDKAVRNLVGNDPMEAGFTYSLSPKGAVYPFSEIEVSCIMQEKYARKRGPELCRDFFEELGLRIRKAVAGRQ